MCASSRSTLAFAWTAEPVCSRPGCGLVCPPSIQIRWASPAGSVDADIPLRDLRFDSPLRRGRVTSDRRLPELPADQTTVRRANLGVVMRHVAGNAPCSRARIAAETGLTRGTVSSLVAELVELDLVREGGGDGREGRVGRPAQPLELTDTAVAVGLEIKVDSLEVSVGDLTGSVRHERRVFVDNRSSPAGPVLDGIARMAAEAIDTMDAEGLRVAGIAVDSQSLGVHRVDRLRGHACDAVEHRARWRASVVDEHAPLVPHAAGQIPDRHLERVDLDLKPDGDSRVGELERLGGPADPALAAVAAALAHEVELHELRDQAGDGAARQTRLGGDPCARAWGVAGDVTHDDAEVRAPHRRLVGGELRQAPVGGHAHPPESGVETEVAEGGVGIDGPGGRRHPPDLYGRR